MVHEPRRSCFANLCTMSPRAPVPNSTFLPPLSRSFSGSPEQVSPPRLGFSWICSRRGFHLLLFSPASCQALPHQDPCDFLSSLRPESLPKQCFVLFCTGGASDAFPVLFQGIPVHAVLSVISFFCSCFFSGRFSEPLSELYCFFFFRCRR